MGLGIMGFCVFCFVHFGDTSLPKGIFIVLLALGGFILLVASLSVIGKACNSRVALFLVRKSFLQRRLGVSSQLLFQSKWLGAILALALIASAVGVVCYHEKIEDYVKGLKMEKDVQNRIDEELQSFSPIIGGVLGGLGLLQVGNPVHKSAQLSWFDHLGCQIFRFLASTMLGSEYAKGAKSPRKDAGEVISLFFDHDIFTCEANSFSGKAS